MFFKDISKLVTVVERRTIEDNPELIYKHFMDYDDEVFYILERGKIYGIITPGDLFRAYLNAEDIIINKNFKYINDKNDLKRTEEIFAEFPTIHEVAVVKDEVLLGIVISDIHKDLKEWEEIRTNLKYIYERRDLQRWKKEEILKLMNINSSFYIYPCLTLDISYLNKKEQLLYKKRMGIRRRSGTTPLDVLSTFTDGEYKNFFGGGEYKEKFKAFMNFSKEVKVNYYNGIPYMKNYQDKYHHIENGYRITPNTPVNAKHKIYMYGPCMILGSYVSDNETISSYLQKQLITLGYTNYEVVNHSVGYQAIGNPNLFAEYIDENDIIIIMTADFDLWKNIQAIYSEKVKCLDSINDIWDGVEHPLNHIIDYPVHCNYKINEKVAIKIFQDIEKNLYKINEDSILKINRKQLQKFYISWDILKYYENHLKKSKERIKEHQKIGAIVMNCNPFTKGHRYLVEEAIKMVDLLYVFVVEEDKSVFPFEQRFKMVKMGLADMENVVVISSGKYIISQETFSQYFNKENISIIEDMQYDVHIFGTAVAKQLNITYRFVGQEPYDLVTNSYNQKLKEILPEYGIHVVEIPRTTDTQGEIISASKVRKYLTECNGEKLKEMLPQTTINLLGTK